MIRLALAVLVACGGKDKPATCAEQMTELRAFLRAANDPARPPLAAPFPTGDAARDHKIEQIRAYYRAQLAPVDPGRRLAPMADTANPADAELDACPAARAQLAKVGAAPPGQGLDAIAGVADAIATCGCNVDLPVVRAAFYIAARGP